MSDVITGTQKSANGFITLKKYLFAIFMLVLLLPFFALNRAGNPASADFWAFQPLLVIFLLIPVLDHIFGRDPVNPLEEDVPMLSSEHWYKWLTLLAVPGQLLMIFMATSIFVNYEHFSLLGKVGWILSVGCCAAIVGINVAHELVHKDGRFEQWAGGILLSSVTYAGFKVEHIRGHHVHVSTPQDASSSRYNQSLYNFLPKALKNNFINAWKLEAEKLRRQGHSPVSWRNELIWWYGLSILFASTLGLVFGPEAVFFFFAQGLVAGILLEIINYIEHYGLHRRKKDNGRYERVTVEHSWNSNFFLTNMLLFHLQRHSDHHANPKRRYQALRHFEESPQLPSGYATMVVLALIPPLWFRVMNPKVEAYYADEEYQLTESQLRS